MFLSLKNVTQMPNSDFKQSATIYSIATGHLGVSQWAPDKDSANPRDSLSATWTNIVPKWLKGASDASGPNHSSLPLP